MTAYRVRLMVNDAWDEDVTVEADDPEEAGELAEDTYRQQQGHSSSFFSAEAMTVHLATSPHGVMPLWENTIVRLEPLDL